MACPVVVSSSLSNVVVLMSDPVAKRNISSSSGIGLFSYRALSRSNSISKEETWATVGVCSGVAAVPPAPMPVATSMSKPGIRATGPTGTASLMP